MTAAPRTLPLRLQPVEGEALDSWLEALAHRHHSPLGNLLEALGLPSPKGQQAPQGPSPTDRTIMLRPHEVSAIAHATGVEPAQVTRMTLAHFHGTALLLRERQPRVNRHVLWGRASGSRFCPDCLASSGGRWQLTWRLGWSFACVHHLRLLADTCPCCGNAQRDRPHQRTEIPHPGRCRRVRNREPEDRRPARCGHELTDVSTLTLPAGHFALRAQTLILGAIASGVAQFGIYARSPQPVAVALSDVRTVASRLLATANPEELSSVVPADLIEEHLAIPRGLRMALKRPGFMAPPTAVSTAVAITAALKALSEPDIQQAASIMRDLLRAMEREDRAATASDIYHWGKDSSPFLHAVHLAALGPSMRPSHQLRYRTITEFPVRPALGSQLTARRLNKVPTMFWPAWTIRLTPASGVSHTALQPTLSSALLMIGSRSERDDAAGQLGSATDKATISRILQVLRDDRCWPDIHRALDRLAGYLDDHNAPIDYERRRNLDYRHLLPHEQWLDIRQRLKITTGGERQWRITRCVLFQRISGLPVEADAPIAPGDTHFRVELGSFPARQTPEIAVELKDVARRFLAGHGIDDEPISWQPPLEILEGLDLPGRDPQEVDVRRLHQLVRSGRTSLERVVTTLGSTYDAVRHVLEENPAPQTRIAAPSKHAARQTLPADEFSRLYQQERLSLQDISDLTGFSRGTLTALATEYGIALRPVGGQPRHEMVEHDWLFEEYVVQRRPLSELARERGVSKATMRTWARLHRIPMRSPGGASHGVALRTARLAEAAPALLRPAMTSAYSCERLLRFAQAAKHHTLRSAANQIGCGEDTLALQIRRLEHDLGGPLLEPFDSTHSIKLTDLGKRAMIAIHQISHEEIAHLVDQRPGGRAERHPHEMPGVTASFGSEVSGTRP